MKQKLKSIVQFIANPHLLICIGIAWIITNGWSYIMLGIGTWLKINWMKAVATAYIAFLWLPVSPEKLVTVAIAIGLLRLIFPNDKKTLAVLRKFAKKFKNKSKKKKQKKGISEN